MACTCADLAKSMGWPRREGCTCADPFGCNGGDTCPVDLRHALPCGDIADVVRSFTQNISAARAEVQSFTDALVDAIGPRDA